MTSKETSSLTTPMPEWLQKIPKILQERRFSRNLYGVNYDEGTDKHDELMFLHTFLTVGEVPWKTITGEHFFVLWHDVMNAMASRQKTLQNANDDLMALMFQQWVQATPESEHQRLQECVERWQSSEAMPQHPLSLAMHKNQVTFLEKLNAKFPTIEPMLHTVRDKTWGYAEESRDNEDDRGPLAWHNAIAVNADKTIAWMSTLPSWNPDATSDGLVASFFARNPAMLKEVGKAKTSIWLPNKAGKTCVGYWSGTQEDKSMMQKIYAEFRPDPKNESTLLRMQRLVNNVTFQTKGEWQEKMRAERLTLKSRGENGETWVDVWLDHVPKRLSTLEETGYHANKQKMKKEVMEGWLAAIPDAANLTLEQSHHLCVALWLLFLNNTTVKSTNANITHGSKNIEFLQPYKKRHYGNSELTEAESLQRWQQHQQSIEYWKSHLQNNLLPLDFFTVHFTMQLWNHTTPSVQLQVQDLASNMMEQALLRLIQTFEQENKRFGHDANVRQLGMLFLMTSPKEFEVNEVDTSTWLKMLYWTMTGAINAQTYYQQEKEANEKKMTWITHTLMKMQQEIPEQIQEKRTLLQSLLESKKLAWPNETRVILEKILLQNICTKPAMQNQSQRMRL